MSASRPFSWSLLPRVGLRVLEDLTPSQPPGFLRVLRRRLCVVDEHGAQSAGFVYDEASRRCLDAVVIAAYYRASEGVRVYLRSALRPPVCLREAHRIEVPGSEAAHGLWELPAGLVEAHEESLQGARECARRELHEELGFGVPASSIEPLGPSSFPSPGMAGERHFFFKVEVAPESRQAPALDGSVIEAIGQIRDVSLEEALDACRSGVIEDAKTELGLRRLREALA